MTLGDTLGPEGKRPELYGIGGWLAFLCVSLLILTPLALGAEVFVTLMARAMPIMQKSFIVAVDLAVGAFTVLTGLGLVRRWRNAVRTATWYFVISIGVSLPGTIAFLLTSEEASAPEVISIVRWLIGSTVWLIYLHRSERVRNTYATHHAESAAEVFS